MLLPILFICLCLPNHIYGNQLYEKNFGISRGKYKNSHKTLTAGFVIRKEGFFRYAYINSNSSSSSSPPPPSPTTAPEPPSENLHFLDVDNMKKYYVKEIYDELKSTSELMDTDFQMLEWPGKNSQQHQDTVKEHLRERKEYCSSDVSDKCKVWMLQFDRDNGKIQHYPCNAQEGTDVVALASIRSKESATESKTDPAAAPDAPPAASPTSSSEEDEGAQKIWLSHGTKSIYTRYIQPMFVPEKVLLDMARKEGDFCAGIPKEDSSSSGDSQKQNLADLRTVHDFTFTRGRLILGMKCGILIVSGLTKDHLTFEVATLRAEAGLGKNFFPEPINRVSATVCCSLSVRECTRDQGIVAAYAHDLERSLDDKKFLYVSFDRGTLFEKKLLASRYAPINLIVGLYKLYQEWHHYYELLNAPDDDDLSADTDFIKNLRGKPMWISSTVEGKEKLFGIGATIEDRKKTSLRKVAELLHHQVSKRRQRLKNKVRENLTPRWVQHIFDNFRNKFADVVDTTSKLKYEWNPSWTDESCDEIEECSELFKNDAAVEWLLNEANITVKTPKIAEKDGCLEITSILVISEERVVLALCRVDDPPGFGTNQTQTTTTGDSATTTANTNSGDSPPPPPPGRKRRDAKVDDQTQGSDDTEEDEHKLDPHAESGFFAFFKFPLHTNTPLTHSELVSQRIFYCKFIKNTMDPKKPRIIQPEIIRFPGSVTVFVTNCEGIVYVSTNFGTTLFNAAFYFKKENVTQDCEKTGEAQNGANKAGTATPSDSQGQGSLDVELCSDRPETEKPNYVRSFYLCALNVPPIITADRLGSVLVMTFGRFYARGAIAYNRETRFLVGQSLEELTPDQRFENIVFPGLNSNGEAILALSMARAYSIPDTKFRKPLYTSRNSIRLVPMPFELYREIRPYYSSNLAACQNALEKGLAFPPCQTISFSVKPKTLSLDLWETKKVFVNVMDNNPYLPLWIFSSNGNSVEVNASLNIEKDNGTSDDDLPRSHYWDVLIRAKPNQKDLPEVEHLVDAFFGSDYSKLHDYSTQISLVNTPNIRCHVQPTATVDVEIGCKGKKIVPHEDDHRPQCQQFKDFTYIIQQGMFDPEMANYWIAKESEQSHSYVKILQNGDLSITYDYASWGCPLEPFVSDDFVPDLRIVQSGTNSTKGDKFRGKFILIEIFGAKGFSYKKKVRDTVLKSCKRPPFSLRDYIEEWKHRQRLFKIANERLVFPPASADLDAVDWLNDVKGNKIFHNDAVKEHINIWNRANYFDCNEFYNKSIDRGMTEDDLQKEYEVLTSLAIDEHDDDDGEGGGENDEDDQVHWKAMVERARKEKQIEEQGEGDLEGLEEEEERHDEEDELDDGGKLDNPNKIVWGPDRQRVYLFLAVAIDEYDSMCNYQTIFGVSLRSMALDISDLYSIIVFIIFLIFWILLMIAGFYVRRSYLRTSYLKQARMKKLEQAAWTIVYRYEKMIHDQELKEMLYADDEINENEAGVENNVNGEDPKSTSKPTDK